MKQYDREILSVLMTYRGNRDRDSVSSNDLGKNAEMGFLLQHESLVENERGGREGERQEGNNERSHEKGRWQEGRMQFLSVVMTSRNYTDCKNREIGREIKGKKGKEELDGGFCRTPYMSFCSILFSGDVSVQHFACQYLF